MSEDRCKLGCSDAIRHVRRRYIEQGICQSYFKINDGNCAQFADDVLELLSGNADIFCVCNENFMCGLDGDEFENEVWDWRLLRKSWRISVPTGLRKRDVDSIDFGSHVWLTDGERHYDAEAPDGVDSLFDLPIFRRAIVQALREKGIAAKDVCVEDIVPAPICPIQNPKRRIRSPAP